MAEDQILGVYPHLREIDGFIVHLERSEGNTTVETEVMVDAKTYEVLCADVVRRTETYQHLDADETRALVDVDAVVRAARAWRR